MARPASTYRSNGARRNKPAATARLIAPSLLRALRSKQYTPNGGRECARRRGDQQRGEYRGQAC